MLDLESINFSCSHPNNADLDFYLVSPDNTVLVISTDNGGTGDNYSNVTFSDAGSSTPPTANTNFSNVTYKPEGQTFASYTGTLTGDWVLYAIDDQSSNVGDLTSFSITVNKIAEATLNLYNMVVNNNSTGVTTNNDINIVNPAVVTLTKGAFFLNDHTLTLNNNATTAISAGSTTSYIVSETNSAINNGIILWKMGTTTGAHVFPFGLNGSYLPFTFNKTTSGAADISVSTRATSSSNNLPLAGVSSVAAVTNMSSVYGGSAVSSVIDRWWDITKSAAVTANLIFTYRGSENTISTSPTGTIKMQHWNGTAWDAPVGNGSGVTSGTGTVSVTGATTFSPWVAVTSIQPLPIDLLTFTAKCAKKKVILNWSTASEKNNDFFTIERSADGKLFTPIGVIPGSGNSNFQMNYSYTDSANSNKQAYYRLIQTDYDGTSKSHKIVAVDKCLDEENKISIFYNRQEEIMLNIQADADQLYVISLANILGKTLWDESYRAIEGTNTYSVETSNLSEGVYFLMVYTTTNKLTQKIYIR